MSELFDESKRNKIDIKTKYTDTGVYCVFKWLDRDYWEICYEENIE